MHYKGIPKLLEVVNKQIKRRIIVLKSYPEVRVLQKSWKFGEEREGKVSICMSILTMQADVSKIFDSVYNQSTFQILDL